MLMHTTTRKILVFASITDCSSFLGVTYRALDFRLRNERLARPYKEFYVKFADDPTPWPNKIKFRKALSDGVPIIMPHVETGVVEQFSRMTVAGERLGCHAGTIGYQANKDNPTPYRGYLIRYA